MTNTTEYLIQSFATSKDWRSWLEKNHTNSPGIWLHFYKKDSGIPSITYLQALDEALCFGWIDGQAKPYDETSWLQKFTRRKPKSIWSKRNTIFAQRLIKEGKMTEAGMKQIEAAKADGRWDAAYNSPKNIIIPEDFLKELSKNKEAEAFFKTLNKTNTYAIAWRLQTAKKPETREKRMKAILQMLAKKEKFH